MESVIGQSIAEQLNRFFVQALIKCGIPVDRIRLNNMDILDGLMKVMDVHIFLKHRGKDGITIIVEKSGQLIDTLLIKDPTLTP